jgi:hypothetical protein
VLGAISARKRSGRRGGLNMNKLPIIISLLSVVISAVTFVISFWYNSWHRPAIDAAIDLSIKNLYGDIAQLRNHYYDVMTGKFDSTNRLTKNDSANAYIYYLEYISKLLNSNQLNENYISNGVKCQIIENYKRTYLDKRFFESADEKSVFPALSQVPEMQQFFEKNREMVCR